MKTLTTNQPLSPNEISIILSFMAGYSDDCITNAGLRLREKLANLYKQKTGRKCKYSPRENTE